MATITYSLPPILSNNDGELSADQPLEVSGPDRARRQAERLARAKGGTIAFSRTADPALGDFEDAVILASFGEVPDTLSEPSGASGALAGADFALWTLRSRRARSAACL